MMKADAIKLIRSCLRVQNGAGGEIQMAGASTLFGVGIALMLAGIIVIVAALILLVLTGVKQGGKVKGGGAVIIGPFPIIFGTDKESVKTLLLLSLALTILLIVMAVTYFLLFK
jgi:uncharacterized protein (TIGR00304 family)